MSIINDAIKKARREFEKGKKDAARDILKEEKLGAPISKLPRRKWGVALIGVSLAFIVSILGSLFLYRYMSKLNVSYVPAMPSVEKDLPPLPPTDTLSSEAPQKAVFPTVEFEDIAKLNGIVYGTKDKWAIINNKIFREGDSFLDGKLALIAKDFVKIEKNNGEEIILNLR